MRHSFALFAFCLLAPHALTASAADSFFSPTTLDSVFTPSGPPTSATSTERPYTAPPTTPPPPSPSSPAPAPSGKPLAVEQLAELFKQAGFETKDVGEKTLSTKTKVDTWAFPVIATISDDQKQVWLVLLLSVVKDEKQIPVDKLLNLMSANRQYAPAYFSFSTKFKRTELYRSLNSQELTSDLLKEEVARLATIAKETQSLWNFASTTPTAPLAATPITPAPTTPPPAASPAAPGTNTPPNRNIAGPTAAPGKAPNAIASTLTGKWSASSSDKEGFALLLGTDGKFTLVHVNNGKQTRSTGKFTHNNQQLTLNGDDGTQLAGTVASQSDQAFQFTLQSKNNKPAVLAFKRAK